MICKKIALACDHAGYELKEKLKLFLLEKDIEIVDFGTNSAESVDYADFAHPMAKAIEDGICETGIAVCGTGNGINMTVNKHQKIRAALCWTPEIAQLARAHNDANICSLPARFIDMETAIKIVDIFFNTTFDGGRHFARIKKIPVFKGETIMGREINKL